MLKNLMLLEEENLLGIISTDLSLKKEILTAEDFHKIYSNDMEKIYSILPIETHNFLKEYFTNNKIVPATVEFTQCLNALRNSGIAVIEENHNKNVMFTYDSRLGRLGRESETKEFLQNENEFNNIELDDKVAKSLYQFLNQNLDLIESDKKIRNLIIKTLKKKQSLSIRDLKEILRNEGFEVESTLNFLKSKLSYGTVIIEDYWKATEEDEIIVKYNSKIN
jgi:hypothetical protein